MKHIVDELVLGLRTIVNTGKMIYGFLGIVVMTSVFWFLTSSPVGLWALTVLQMDSFSPLIASVPIFALIGPTTCAALYVVNRAYHKQPFSILDYFRGIKHFFFRSYALAFLYMVVIGIVVFDLYFFLFIQSGIFWGLIGALFVYLLIYLLFVGYYLFGFLVEQDIGIRKAIRRSGMVVLDNFFFSVVVTLMYVVLALASMVLPILFLLIGGCLVCVIQNTTAVLLKKYSAFELRPGEYGGYEGEVDDSDWDGLPDPRKDPDFYGMSEEEIREYHEKKREKRRRRT